MYIKMDSCPLTWLLQYLWPGQVLQIVALCPDGRGHHLLLILLLSVLLRLTLRGRAEHAHHSITGGNETINNDLTYLNTVYDIYLEVFGQNLQT